MKSRVAWLFVIALCAASAASAQVRRGTFEITPFAGYLWGGHFDAGSNALFQQRVDVEDHLDYGVGVGYFWTSLNEFEFRWSESRTHFVNSNGSPVFGPSGQELADLDIDYYMGYWTLNFGHQRAVPYFTFGAGAAVLNPGQRTDIPCPTTGCVEPSSATRFTASMGGGVKLYVNRNFGFKFDGRFYDTYLNSHNCRTFNNGNTFCSDNHSSWLLNGEATGGLVISF
ncbi:MAG TPA: outer membrane beta-barrel protein [Thermoanaerobaculia bacterium]